NLDQARRTFLRGVPAALDATVTVGELRTGTLVMSTKVVQLPARHEWTHAVGELDNLSNSGSPFHAGDVPASLEPFLYVMHCAGLNRDWRYQRRFIHSGKLYSLEARRQSSHPSELFGEILDWAGAKCAEFRASYSAQDDRGIPCRIEYRPKPFLRLVF